MTYTHITANYGTHYEEKTLVIDISLNIRIDNDTLPFFDGLLKDISDAFANLPTDNPGSDDTQIASDATDSAATPASRYFVTHDNDDGLYRVRKGVDKDNSVLIGSTKDRDVAHRIKSDLREDNERRVFVTKGRRGKRYLKFGLNKTESLLVGKFDTSREAHAAKREFVSP